MRVVSNNELQIVAGGQLSAPTANEQVGFNGLNGFNGKVILSPLPAPITPIVEKITPVTEVNRPGPTPVRRTSTVGTNIP